MQSFPGICFTDTFQLYERGQQSLDIGDVLKVNSERVNAQQSTRLEVIIGNPPYRVGQGSANDDAQNQKYANLERRIAATYAKGTAATNKNALYDSYIKAFRWASDRISDGGVIGFVTNAGWLDGAAMDGLRKCFAKEFSAIYVFNLRGNARTQGEQRRRESGNVFGSGSRAPIAITILVKHAAHVGDAEIFYRDIGDYLTADQKLDIINRTPNVLREDFRPLTPNKRGDWINRRGDDFDTFIPLAPDKKFNGKSESFFVVNSRGFETGRDAWVYNFSQAELERNMDEVSKIVVLGRAARNAANIKNRQPVAEMFVKAEPLPEFFVDIIADELNVKAVEFRANMDEFVKYTVKPNFRVLGKKVGKKMGEVQAALKNLNGAAAKSELDKTGELKLGEIILTPEDIEITVAQTEGYNCQNDGEISIALSTTLTPELIEEGFVREIISKVQTMRRDSKFEVTDRIKIYASGNDRLAEIISRNAAEIKAITLADEIISAAAENSRDWDINGEKISLGVAKI